MRIHRPLLATVASVLIISSCGSSGDSTDDSSAAAPATEATEADTVPAGTAAPATAAGGAVGIKGSRFDPLEIEISAGETVTFTNNDPFAHTVTSRDGSPLEFASGELGDGETFQVTFDEAGTYDYFCQIHPTMRAAVTVG